MSNAVRQRRDFDDFLDGYTTAMLWANTYRYNRETGEIEPADCVGDEDRLTDNARARLAEDARAFYDWAAEILPTDEDGDIRWPYTGERAGQWTGGELAGHDFALTRSGHGAGFWDRGLGEIGDRLSDMARSYGSADLYDEDNEIINE